MNVPRALGMIAVFCTLIFIGAACVRTVPPATDIPVVDGSDPSGVLYQQAEGYYRNRFYEKALERYMRIVESNPRSEFAAPSLYKIAGIYMKSKSYEKAVLYFDKLSSEYPRSQFAVEAFYNKGYCYLKLGDPKRGIDALKDYLARSEASHPQRARIYLAEAHVAVGDYDKALVSYGMASTGKVTKESEVEILSDVKKLVDEHTTEQDLEAAAKNCPASHVSDYIHYRLALAAMSRDERGTALSYLKKVDFGRARFAFYQEIRRLLKQFEVTPPSIVEVFEGETVSVGVILPLTGRLSVFGEQVLHGVMLAVDLFASGSGGGSRIEVIIKDSKGDPEVATKAVRDLAQNPEVLAIVGPLMKKTSLAAAREAQDAGIPIITLTTQEDVCDTGGWVFRNATTLSMQVKALLRYAHNQKGCRRFAVLYPDNRLGRTYSNLVSKYIDPMRNDVTAMVSYTSEDADFRQQIRQIKAGGSFDALFIPDDADRVALIAPQLVYFGVKGKVLLGTPGWNQDILAKKAKGYLDDTVIVDGFFAPSHKPNVRAFSEAYQEDFGEAPTPLSGYGFDTVSMLADLFKKGMGEGRATLRTGLLGVREFEGVTGQTTVLENGDVDKELILLRVGDQTIEELF